MNHSRRNYCDVAGPDAGALRVPLGVVRARDAAGWTRASPAPPSPSPGPPVETPPQGRRNPRQDLQDPRVLNT